MTTLRLAAALAAAVLAASSASAQIVPIGPFTGTSSEGFEGATPFQFTPCVQPNVFGGIGTLCDNNGTAAHVTTGWSFNCVIFPHTGSLFTGSAGGYYVYTFSQNVTQFGGYFGSHSGFADATVRFYDASNALLGTTTAAIPASCSWVWQGWQSNGNPIRRVEVSGLNPYGGGFVLMDDMEITVPAGCNPNVTTYCIALISSNGCTPAMGSTGTPSLGNPASFQMTGSNLEVGQNGLMFFGTTGPDNSPFFGGTLCVNAPLYRLLVSNSGGAAPCSGALNYTLADMLAHPSGGPLVVAGAQVNGQVWTRDPPAATTVSLSNGIQFTVCP